MEAIKLQSMTDFVLKIDGIVKQHEDQDIDDWSLNCFGVIENYAKFLKQPLQLCFFVPCDENGNVLEEPKRWNDYLQFPDSFDGNKEWGELYNYELAKERVLFKGFEVEISMTPQFLILKNFANVIFIWDLEAKNFLTNPIYDLDTFANVSKLNNDKIELTDSAIKQIAL